MDDSVEFDGIAAVAFLAVIAVEAVGCCGAAVANCGTIVAS